MRSAAAHFGRQYQVTEYGLTANRALIRASDRNASLGIRAYCSWRLRSNLCSCGNSRERRLIRGSIDFELYDDRSTAVTNPTKADDFSEKNGREIGCNFVQSTRIAAGLGRLL